MTEPHKMTEQERLKYISEHLEEHQEWYYEDREYEREEREDDEP